MMILVAFGMSLYGVFIIESPIQISVADGMIAILLSVSLYRLRSFTNSPVVWAMGLLAGVILLSGLINFWNNPFFSLGSFAVNYIRIIGIVALLLFAPPLFRTVGSERLATGVLVVIRIHTVALLVDAMGLLPTALSPSNPALSRPTGFFPEPGWFGIYMILSVFYLLQHEHTTRTSKMRAADLALIIFSVVISTGLRGIIMLVGAIVVIVYVHRGQLKTHFRLLAILLFAVIAAPIIISTLPDSGISSSLIYLRNRAPGAVPTQFSDESGLERVNGTVQIITIVFDHSPWVGVGLGGNNMREGIRFLDESSYVFNERTGKIITPNSGNMLAAVLLAAGIPGALAFLIILGQLLWIRETRILGTGLLLVVAVWGAPFETFIWWFIALGIANVHSRARARSPQQQQLVTTA